MWHHKQTYNINQRGENKINDVSVIKYQKYSWILIIKHADVLAEVIKSHDVNLYNIMQDKKCKLLKSTYTQWPYCKLVGNKKFQTPV